MATRRTVSAATSKASPGRRSSGWRSHRPPRWSSLHDGSISHGGTQVTTRQTMRPMQATFLIALPVPELETRRQIAGHEPAPTARRPSHAVEPIWEATLQPVSQPHMHCSPCNSEGPLQYADPSAFTAAMIVFSGQKLYPPFSTQQNSVKPEQHTSRTRTRRCADARRTAFLVAAELTPQWRWRCQRTPTHDQAAPRQPRAEDRDASLDTVTIVGRWSPPGRHAARRGGPARTYQIRQPAAHRLATSSGAPWPYWWNTMSVTTPVRPLTRTRPPATAQTPSITACAIVGGVSTAAKAAARRKPSRLRPGVEHEAAKPA